MGYAEVYTGEGYACYTCNSTPDARPVFHFVNLPHPYTWVCSTCLTRAILDNQIVLTGGDGKEADGSCDACGNGLDASTDGAYCEDCFSNQECEESHGCDYCGERESEIYCYDHAQSEWSLVDPDTMECDECGDNSLTKSHYLCNVCFTQVSSPPDVTYAQAAEPIDVDWADD